MVFPGPDQDKRRKSIIAILAGALFALATSRILADVAPYRVRPMYDPSLTHHPYSFPVSLALIDWSSFPSDNATLFFGLAFGLAYLMPRLAIPAMLYTAVWICLPRMFLGEHYAPDVVVGAAVGIAVVWVSLNVKWIQKQIRGACALDGGYQTTGFLSDCFCRVLRDQHTIRRCPKGCQGWGSFHQPHCATRIHVRWPCRGGYNLSCSTYRTSRVRGPEKAELFS